MSTETKKDQSYLLACGDGGVTCVALAHKGEFAFFAVDNSNYAEDFLDKEDIPTAAGLYVWEGDITITVIENEGEFDMNGATRRATLADLKRFGMEILAQ